MNEENKSQDTSTRDTDVTAPLNTEEIKEIINGESQPNTVETAQDDFAEHNVPIESGADAHNDIESHDADDKADEEHFVSAESSDDDAQLTVPDDRASSKRPKFCPMCGKALSESEALHHLDGVGEVCSECLAKEKESVDTDKKDIPAEDAHEVRNNDTEPAVSVPVTQPHTTELHKPAKKKTVSHALEMVLLGAGVFCLGLSGGLMGASMTQTSNQVNVHYSEIAGSADTVSLNGLADTIEDVIDCVVEINTTVEETGYTLFGQAVTQTGEAAGSGVIISDTGYILTNNHVIEDATSITVRLNNEEEYTATLVGTDEKTDIAVIKIEPTSELTVATLGNSDGLRAGDEVFAIGNALGTLNGTVTNGIVSSSSREVTISNETMDLIQTNVEVNSGNSGGGLFDTAGNLVGIVNAKISGTTSSGTTIDGIGFAIPINKAMDIAQDLMTTGSVDRVTLGVQVQDVTSNATTLTAGLYVVGVTDGSVAEAAGFETYDRIIKANDTEITCYSDLSKFLEDVDSNDTVKFTVERGGEEIELTADFSSGSTNL